MQLTAMPGEWVEALKCRPLFAIFDRDGTLVPLTNDPGQAYVSEGTRELIGQLANLDDVAVAIVSARSCAHLKEDFVDLPLILAGNYGLEVTAADGRSFVEPSASATRPRLLELKTCLTTRLPIASGIIMEDHGLSLCLHWQMAAEAERERLRQAMAGLQAEFPDLTVRQLMTSLEVLPTNEWSKAMAMEQVIALSNIASGSNADLSDWLFLFAGDSDQDEPLFQWVNTRGGVSIVVGDKRDSRALYSVASPDALMHLLQEIIEIRADFGVEQLH